MPLDKNRKMFKKILLILIPILTIPAFYIASALYIKYVKPHIPTCLFFASTGYYCPGCGITRSIENLLTGNPIQSLRYNPIPILTLIFFAILYFEAICDAFFNYPIKIIPRNDKFVFAVLGIMLAYSVVRNFFR